MPSPLCSVRMLSPRFIPESVFYTKSVVRSPQSVFYTDRSSIVNTRGFSSRVGMILSTPHYWRVHFDSYRGVRGGD